VNSGAVPEGHLLGEIGEVLLGKINGRQSDADITLYKSLGHIIQDIAAAEYIYDRLKAQVQ
jgi:ornithine cyclodeaminase